jgi:tetratricopeptide (TPR) repeat protein
MRQFLFRSLSIGLRVLIAAVCCVGIWSSYAFARADFLFRKDTPESVAAAIRLVPDSWEYYMRLSQFDHEHAMERLANSLRLNRYNAQADIELGLEYEAEGDFDRAEKLLLEAYAVDHTYLPRWSLANYYFRRDNMPAFWAWARRAAEMPADDIGPLFELCWHVEPDPERISSAILVENPEVVRQYIGFLLTKDQLPAVAIVAPRLVRLGTQETDRPLLFAVVNRLVSANDASSANALWHMLIDQRWVVADASVPNNGAFAREPLPVSFDWSLPEYAGLHSWPGASGLEAEFTGSEPEDCIIAEQAVTLAPGNYTLAYAYRTSDIAQGTGLHWEIIEAKAGAVLAESPDLSSDAVKHSAFEFSVPPDASFLRLRLRYHRALGTTRISGMLVVISTEIQAIPHS